MKHTGGECVNRTRRDNVPLPALGQPLVAFCDETLRSEWWRKESKQEEGEKVWGVAVQAGYSARWNTGRCKTPPGSAVGSSLQRPTSGASPSSELYQSLVASWGHRGWCREGDPRWCWLLVHRRSPVTVNLGDKWEGGGSRSDTGALEGPWEEGLCGPSVPWGKG